MMTMLTGGPASPVAVNVAGVTPETVAVRVFVPDVVPRVQLPTVARPEASVVCDAPVMLPPPDVTAKVTGTPLSGLATASVTRTRGAVGTETPTGLDCPL